MSGLQTTTSRQLGQTHLQLRKEVQSSARRGRLFASIHTGLLCMSAMIAGLFFLALKDALFVLSAEMRLVLLILLTTSSMAAFAVLAIRPWRDKTFTHQAGEHIDAAAHEDKQPVTVGLTLKDPTDDDSLAQVLLQRAELRASHVARSVRPAQAYPMQLLRGPGSWLGMAVGLWLLLGLILPSQAFSMFSRVVMPWLDAPPFTLTQMQPQWTPEPPTAGDDVVLSVVPEGRMPEEVDWIVLNDHGDEAERFPMVNDGQGGFSYVLRQVDAPIQFRLEAFGRHTRTYTITPTPRPPIARTEDEGEGDEGSVAEPDGTTQFDPDKAARRDLEAHRDWPGIKADLEKLLRELAKAQAEAESIAPSDVEAMQALADKLGDLSSQAKAIADKLAAMQGELPAEAAQLIDALGEALANMKSAALPAAPSSSEGTPINGEPTPAQWLDQAADAAKTDQNQIGKGLGPSDLPSESGTTSGNPEESPEIRDPSTTGTHRETSGSGDTGPLPDAVIRQIPPSYRDHVSAYFERLAQEKDNP